MPEEHRLFVVCLRTSCFWLDTTFSYATLYTLEIRVNTLVNLSPFSCQNHVALILTVIST